MGTRPDQLPRRQNLIIGEPPYSMPPDVAVGQPGAGADLPAAPVASHAGEPAGQPASALPGRPTGQRPAGGPPGGMGGSSGDGTGGGGGTGGGPGDGTARGGEAASGRPRR